MSTIESGGYKYTPKTFTFTITDEASTATPKPTQTIITGPEISYDGTAAGWHFAFTHTFEGWVFLKYGDQIRVGADDNGSVSVADLTAESPAGMHEFQWGEPVTFTGTTGWYWATATHTNLGGPYGFVIEGLAFYDRVEIENPDLRVPTGDTPKQCPTNCNCNSAPTMANGSVNFLQPFGKTPWATGVPAGTLTLNIEYPDADFYSPIHLQFEHYLTRKVLSRDAETQSATISADGLWKNVYENGVPASENSWKNSQVIVSANGTVCEILEDQTKIFYDANGDFSYVQNALGNAFSKTQLGVEILRDAAGAIRQIWSLTDGLLDIVTLDATHYEICWYKNGDFSKNASGIFVPAGTPIKIFTIGKPSADEDNSSLELIETRGTNFEFHYRWQYGKDEQTWTFENGDFTSVRKWFGIEDDFRIAESCSRGDSREEFSETISPTNGNRYTGKTAGNTTEFSSTRVPENVAGTGKIASTTDRAGATTSYEYDSAGRVIREAKTGGFAGLIEEKIYAYAAGTPADFRPIQIVHKIAGTVFVLDLKLSKN